MSFKEKVRAWLCAHLGCATPTVVVVPTPVPAPVATPPVPPVTI